MPKIFISYRHVEPDQNLAQFLVDCFQRNGLDVFIDTQMLTGTRWIDEIESQIRSSSFFVVLLAAINHFNAMPQTAKGSKTEADSETWPNLRLMVPLPCGESR